MVDFVYGDKLMTLTANYIKIENGYMGQIIEWPEVVTEGNSIEECRLMLNDALEQMILAYKQLGYSLPLREVHYEQMFKELDYVC